MNLRMAASPLLVLAALVPLATACGSPTESEGPSESSQDALSKDLVCPVNSTLPQCKPAISPACYAEIPECTRGAGSWEAGTPQGLTPTSQAEDAAWISALMAAGCTPPTTLTPNVNAGIELFVTTCPVAPAQLPPLPPDLVAYDGFAGTLTYGELQLGCNACFLTLPPAGTFRFAWFPFADRPGGCKMGSCASVQ